MQLTSGVEIPDGLLAAMPQLAENSRQGFEQITGTMHWASGFVISHTSLGIIGPLYDTCTESRYTGKERDAESGNDYFGARYYASTLGRWMSPDWAAQAEPVPYAKLDDPQSLNLYGYVQNNPLSNSDPDGHDILASLRNMDPFDADSIQNSFPLDPIFPDIDAQMSADRQAAEAPPQSTANINALAQAQYNNDVPIIAKQLGISTDEVLHSIHIKIGKDGNADVIGGHVNMTVASGSDALQALMDKLGPGKHGYNEDDKGIGQGSEFSRLGGTPSVHLDSGLLHVDRFNAGAWGGFGVVPHFFYDFLYGGLEGNVAMLPY